LQHIFIKFPNFKFREQLFNGFFLFLSTDKRTEGQLFLIDTTLVCERG